jgi:hypothetical protein
MSERIHKYPRTRHIEGSRLQPGDEDLAAVPFRALAGRHLVVEEKVDGANAAISFDAGGGLRLQSRGHYLTGGPRERHFNLFKQWARIAEAELGPVLRDRYVLYGEWLYAKHTIFYDRLPHYFMEFDVLDLRTGEFLSTPRRREMLEGLPLVSVRVLHEGEVGKLKELTAMVGRSAFISDDHLARLRDECARRSLDVERVLRETDASSTMEGLYVKVEEGGVVKERYKFIRASFLAAVSNADGHWLARPILPNRLAPGAELIGGGGEE